MSNFSIKPIETTAERLEKIANMKIDDVNIDENSDNNSLPTSKVVKEAIMGETEKYLPLQAETTWIFDGGDASSELDILYKIDDKMSDTSENAVKNKVVKKYVDDKLNDTNKKIENVDAKFTYIADNIIEQGTSGMWSYTKYASGKCEMWGTTYENATTSIQRGGMHRTEDLRVSLPFTVYNCHCFVDCTDANAWASIAPKNMTTDIITYVVWHGDNTTYDWYTQWYVVGRWKQDVNI